jgi:hypothetical protein
VLPKPPPAIQARPNSLQRQQPSDSLHTVSQRRPHKRPHFQPRIDGRSCNQQRTTKQRRRRNQEQSRSGTETNRSVNQKETDCLVYFLGFCR